MNKDLLKYKQYDYLCDLNDHGYNVVTCGNCATPIIHKTTDNPINDIIIMCHKCGYKSEPANFPDIAHEMPIEVYDNLIEELCLQFSPFYPLIYKNNWENLMEFVTLLENDKSKGLDLEFTIKSKKITITNDGNTLLSRNVTNSTTDELFYLIGDLFTNYYKKIFNW